MPALQATAGLAHTPEGIGCPVQHTADHLVTFALQQETFHLPRWRDDFNVAALVLTIKWPANSMNQAYSGSGKLLEGLQRSAAHHMSPSGRAQRCWRLIRTLYIEYQRAHKCAAFP